jgi:hypothetical protein
MELPLIATWTAATSHPQCGGFYTQNKIYETLRVKIILELWKPTRTYRLLAGSFIHVNH